MADLAALVERRLRGSGRARGTEEVDAEVAGEVKTRVESTEGEEVKPRCDRVVSTADDTSGDPGWGRWMWTVVEGGRQLRTWGDRGRGTTKWTVRGGEGSVVAANQRRKRGGYSPLSRTRSTISPVTEAPEF